jgi:4'-phosphopantetheinyl transferase
VVEIFGFRLEVDAARRARWLGWLSAQERARVERYTDARHGERYLAAHAQLRWLLGRRMGAAPEALAFARAPQGKPYVPGAPLRFNLSHCREFALVALHPRAEVGVDLESAEAGRDWLALARRFFTPRESAWLAALAPGEQPRAFCRLWTLKEAWMKADGRGLGAGLRAVEIQLAEGQAPELGGAPGWRAQELEAPPGFAAAVVWAEPAAAAAPPPGALKLEWLAPPP